MKLLVVAAFAAALLAIGGVGFAWGGGGCHGYDHGKCHTSLDISWVSPTTTAPSATGVGCTAAPTPGLLTATASGLFPGALCWLNATIENTGKVPVYLVPHISATLPKGCVAYTFSDNLLSASPQVELGVGHTFAYRAQIGLSAAAGGPCEGSDALFQVSITASGSPSCQGFPQSPSYTNDPENCCG